MRKKTAQMRRPAGKRANRQTPPAIDTFDRKILQALVENARASNVEIAHKVGLSEAPCSRRIRRLETDEVILGYHARLDPDAVGIGFEAFVTLVLDYVTATTAERFYQEMRAIPEVMSCYIVSGGYDALLHVAAKDSQAYSEIVFDRLRRIPGVKDVS